jgi:hypothetical protein
MPLSKVELNQQADPATGYYFATDGSGVYFDPIRQTWGSIYMQEPLAPAGFNPSSAMMSYNEMKSSGELNPPEQSPRSGRPTLDEILSHYHYDPNRLIFAEIPTSPAYIQLDDYHYQTGETEWEYHRRPKIGPLLISGPSGSGKTDFLKAFAKSINLCHTVNTVTFSVLTANPQEWAGWERVPHNNGILSLSSNASQDYLLSLASWAHTDITSDKRIILLVDDLEAASQLDYEARQNLRWLLLRGPERRVWPVVSANQDNIPNMRAWVDNFSTRITSIAPFTFVLYNSQGTSDPFMVPTIG